MITAKLFKHGGSQALRLPKQFRFEGSEVLIEKKGNSIMVHPKPLTLADIVREMHEKFPGENDFPDVPRPKKHDRPILEW